MTTCGGAKCFYLLASMPRPQCLHDYTTACNAYVELQNSWRSLLKQRKQNPTPTWEYTCLLYMYLITGDHRVWVLVLLGSVNITTEDEDLPNQLRDQLA